MIKKSQTKQKNNNGQGSVFQEKSGYWRAKIQLGISHSGKPIVKSFVSKTQKGAKDKLKQFKK